MLSYPDFGPVGAIMSEVAHFIASEAIELGKFLVCLNIL